MPSFCAVVGCGSRGIRDDVKFFRIPAVVNYKHKPHLVVLSKLRRERWLLALRRADLTEKKIKYFRVCSKHFIGGKPASLVDKSHPDWIPTQNMGYI